jgi:D-alanyl-D-alanine carboxypeptidase
MSRRMVIGILVTLILAVLAVAFVFRGRLPAVDVSMPDRDTRVRAFFGTLVGGSFTPGLQYVVVNAAGPVLIHADGMADLRTRTPVTSDTTMMWYSVSKTVTAAAVLQLVADGRIGLDDPVERYVPELPYGPDVTIRRSLSHTAGVPSPIPLAWVHPAARHDGFDERVALDEVLAEHPKTSAEPGSRFRYSNLGYWLLGPVVERATIVANATGFDVRGALDRADRQFFRGERPTH